MKIVKRLFAKRLFALLGLFLILITASGCSGYAAAPQDYCAVVVSGFNGYGEITLKCDISAMKNEFIGDKDLNVQEKVDIDRFFSTIAFSISTEKSSGYSNGDVAEVTVEYDEELARQIGFSFIQPTFTYQINGLKEASAVIDPFEGLTITYEGVSPFASAIFDTSACDDYVKSNVSFSVSEDDHIGNGDTVTVKAEYNKTSATADGIVIFPAEKDCVVEGVTEYPQNLDGIDLEEIEATYLDELKRVTALTYQYEVGKTSSYGLFSDDEAIGAVWEVKNVEYGLFDKIYFLKNELNSANDVANNYLTVWKINVTTEKTKSGWEWEENERKYKVGDTYIITKYAVVYTQNIGLTTDGILELNNKVKIEFTDNLEQTINDWKSRNSEDYTIIEMEK